MEAATILSKQEPRQFNGDFQTDFLSVDQLTVADLEKVHQEASILRRMAEVKGEYPLLAGHLYDLVFWDSGSTRTKESFKHAIIRLGAKFVDFHQESSSQRKGETFEDTIEMLDSYLVPERDGLIIRHKQVGSVAIAAELAEAKVINAGDGTGEHPTQAVLDTKTIRERFPQLESIHVAFHGDIANGRTIHSTAPLLAAMGVRRMTFVAPNEALRAEPHMLQELRESGVEVAETDELREIVQQADVLYAVRTQYEFMEDDAEARGRLTGTCLITPEVMEGSEALIMHPLPQDKTDLNIHPELRRDPRCIVKEQAAWGQWTRMSFLLLQAGKSALRMVADGEVEGMRLLSSDRQALASV